MTVSKILRVRGVGIATLVAALGAVFPVSAQAAELNVRVQDNLFDPSRIAAKPNDKVIWSNPGSGEEHNLTFEDGLGEAVAPGTAWSSQRTFPNEGAFPYFCEIHGARGGVGMAGVVYVNSAGNLPPIADFAVSPSPAQPGQTVTFDGSVSRDTDGTVIKYEWDLDGDGAFEPGTSTASRSYASPGTVNVGLRVTDDKGFTEVRTQSLKVNAAPTASFTASPNPAQTGQAVTFDGGGSSDSDGAIARYEWDLDGNGAFETSTTAPTVSYTYFSPATLTVRLRVIDSDGAAGAETPRAVQIDPAPSPPPQQQPSPPAQSTSTAKPPSGSTTKPSSTSARRKPGKCSKLKGKKRAACIKKSCRKLKGSKKRACVKKVTRKS